MQNPQGLFKLHQSYIQSEDFVANSEQEPRLMHPLVILTAINANSFVNCFCEIFALSRKFTKIRVLNLRGLDSKIVSKSKLIRILSNCDQIAHLNLNFMMDQVDE